MIFKISSVLTLALALSSLDAVTSSRITILPEGSKSWVFCYPVCAVMLKSNSIIDPIAVHVGLPTVISTRWVAFIFSEARGAFITEISCSQGCCHISICTLRLRIVVNVVDLHLLLLGLWHVPLRQGSDRLFFCARWQREGKFHGCRHSELKNCFSGFANWCLSS